MPTIIHSVTCFIFSRVLFAKVVSATSSEGFLVQYVTVYIRVYCKKINADYLQLYHFAVLVHIFIVCTDYL